MIKAVKAKKHLGQHFLINQGIALDISNLITENQIKNVLEIGPGTGNLTNFILNKNPSKVFVIEKDDVLANELKIKFPNKLNIINDDVLNVNENSLSKEKLIVFGNLPYNISTEILCKWILNLNDKHQIKSAVYKTK